MVNPMSEYVPLPFSLEHRLSHWLACSLEVRCPCSPRVALIPIRLLRGDGDRRLKDVVSALRCRLCRGRPAPVYLVAGQHRQQSGLAGPNWAVEVVAPPASMGDKAVAGLENTGSS